MLRFLALTCLAATLCAPVAAAPVTFDFDLAAAPVLLAQGDTYSEDGFTLTALIASEGSFALAEGGNPNTAFSVGALGPVVTGDTATITRGGGLFTFLSVEFGSFPPLPGGGFGATDTAQLVGFLGGIEVALFATISSSQGFQTFLNALSGVAIDELRIVGTAQGVSSLNFDNFVFGDVNEVPLPAAAPLFAAGFAGLAALRRRRRAA